MKENWQPKIGEEVWYQPIRMRRGLKQPKVRVLVYSYHPSGTIGARFTGSDIRAVKLVNLSPIE